jgi:hypothetical protein
MARKQQQIDLSKVEGYPALVEPAQAAEWLAGPSAQVRQTLKARVSRYARIMKAGKWQLGWDGIAWLDNGERVNGDHRLKAVVESGVPCYFWIIRGLPQGAVTVGDQGTKRTTRQVLGQMGEPNPSALAPALRYLWQWRNGWQIGDKSQGASPDVTELLDLLRIEPGIRGSVSQGQSLRKHAGLGSDGLGIVLAYLLIESDRAQAEVFLDQLMYGTSLEAGDPILVLRRRLGELRSGSGATKGIDVTYKAAITIKAFNFWRAGVRIEKLGWMRGGKSPESFPGIEPAQELTRVLR